MKVESRGRVFEIEPNSKPYLLKRLIADGFDLMTLFLLFLILTYGISQSPLANTYQKHANAARDIQQEVLKRCNNDKETAKVILSADENYRNERFAADLHGFVLKALAAFVAEIVLFLIIPLSNRYKASCGKLLTGIVLFNEQTQSAASKYQIILRFVILYLFDSIAFYPWCGIYTFLVIPVIRFTCMLLNQKKNKTICDILSGTMPIEKMSYSEL